MCKNMGRCKTCGDELANPVYVHEGHWFCSLDHVKIYDRANEMENYEDSIDR